MPFGKGGKNGNRRPDGTFAPKGTGDLTGALKALHEKSNALKQAKTSQAKAKPLKLENNNFAGQKFTAGGHEFVSGTIFKTSGGHKAVINSSAENDGLGGVKGKPGHVNVTIHYPKESFTSAKGKKTSAGGAHATTMHVDEAKKQLDAHYGSKKAAVAKPAGATSAAQMDAHMKAVEAAKPKPGEKQHVSGLTTGDSYTVREKGGHAYTYKIAGFDQFGDPIIEHAGGSKTHMPKDRVEKLLTGKNVTVKKGSSESTATATAKPAAGTTPDAGVAHKKKLASLQSSRSVAKKAGNEAKVKELDQKIAEHRAAFPGAATKTTAAAGSAGGKSADQKQLASLASQKSRAKGDPERIKAIEEKIAALKGKKPADGGTSAEQLAAHQKAVDAVKPKPGATVGGLGVGDTYKVKEKGGESSYEIAGFDQYGDVLVRPPGSKAAGFALPKEQVEKLLAQKSTTTAKAGTLQATAKPLSPHTSPAWIYPTKPAAKAESEATTTAQSLKDFGKKVDGLNDVHVGDVFFDTVKGETFTVRGGSKYGVQMDHWDSKGKLQGRTEGNSTITKDVSSLDHNVVRLYGATNKPYDYPKKEVAPGINTGDVFKHTNGTTLIVEGKLTGSDDRLRVREPGTFQTTSLSTSLISDALKGNLPKNEKEFKNALKDILKGKK